MARAPKVLVAGEAWTAHSIHQKGFDSFTTAEYDEGVAPEVTTADHPIVAGLQPRWPDPLGYNQVTANSFAVTVARVGGDPPIVAGGFGKWRDIAFASACGPRWAPPGFLEWQGYASLWWQMAAWAGRA